MRFETRIKTKPVKTCITREQLRNFIKSLIPDSMIPREDTLIDDVIISATNILQKYLGVSFITQTLELYAEGVEQDLKLYYGPVQAITTVKFVDAAGVKTLTTSFIEVGLDFKLLRFTSLINTASGVVTYNVEVEYITGYGLTPDTVPEQIRLGIMQQCAADLEFRSENQNIPLMVVSNDARSTVHNLNQVIAFG